MKMISTISCLKSRLQNNMEYGLGSASQSIVMDISSTKRPDLYDRTVWKIGHILSIFIWDL